MSYHNLLSQIYPGLDVDAIEREITDLVHQHGKADQDRNPLSEKDVVLITYADQLRDGSRPHLEVLGDFLDQHLMGYINTIHLLPFYPYSSDDGFSVIDYKKVEEANGDWITIRELSMHYHLVFDAVINHISSQSDWFQGYLDDEPRYQDFFLEVPDDWDLSQVVRPRALPLISKFQTKDGVVKGVWTTFSKDQIDLDYTNPKVLLQVLEVLLFYLSQGARILRLDAIGFMWKESGTTCIHLAQTHALIKLMRAALTDAFPAAILLSETNVPHDENIAYFGDGDEAHMVYNFTLPPLLAYSLLKGDSKKLTSWARSLRLEHPDTTFFNFTASHDGVGVRPVQGILDEGELKVLLNSCERHNGFISYKANPDGTQSPYELNCNYLQLISHPSDSDELRVKKAVLSQAVMLAMPGVPGIYFHTLVGSKNFLAGVEETGMNRTINREKLQLTKLEEELNDRSGFRHQLFTSLRKLIAQRTAEPLFNPFVKFDFPDLHQQVFCIRKWDGSRELMAVHNLGEKEVTIQLPQHLKALDLLSEESHAGADLTMDGYGMYWLKF